MANKHFHITLGPVQGFVAQARRTRDFWAGSFLLSWLSGIAMNAIKKQNGDIKFPIPARGYLEWLEGEVSGQQPPEQGAIPNRFTAISTKVPADFKPEVVEAAIRAAWQALAEAVWKQDLQALDIDLAETRKIWERQIEGFWEISWCLSDDETASNLLDRRKNWRTWHPPVEPGVKCMMMDGWQELSGAERPGRAGQGERTFWKALRKKVGKVDLRQGEELCAIAFVKRRFPYVFPRLQVAMPDNWVAHGWRVPVNVPSVGYLAAAHWLADTIRSAETPEHWDQIWSLHDALSGFEANNSHHAEIPRCVRDAAGRDPEKRQWVRMDGQYLFDFILQTKAQQEPDWQQQVDDAQQYLKKVQGITKTRPSPFYAILRMDGDSLGSQMSDPKKQEPISQALNTFTEKVPGIVSENSGFLVYAGGDDVLALLPMEDAMNCALALRNEYADSFRQHGKGIATSTLSGAIEYCHIKSPLMQGLSDSHTLLDDIAKDYCGRDSLAIRVWKPGGKHLEWSCPWDKAVQGDKLVIDQLADDICQTLQQEKQDINGFAWGFFQKAEQLFNSLGLEQENDLLVEAEAVISLLKSMYLQTGFEAKNQTDASLLAEQLIEQCKRYYRITEDEKPEVRLRKGLSADALKLMRFLVTKGQDKEGQRL
ncbi:type III-B CRISPR-associated protein Cas10/Cmr2 [Endozoicomonas gorgoniicola]|uniref:Type III-B CRISPR-associated protein Cas10/Cmr2 n=1 Tax=Endozoicomonas gorgoniicola TaxID=1234144 RepID=A0ABT3MSD7_9GAMM|nr:type III-B CRISPR-associated protein Cas10/Cmr2 [Endozoicomonas gorgoniicola]MCW7552289.1 type III-B CRISPR-associated protein Cas10/Cmr2 [Endozoicomonas gorgoniicola]